MMASYGDTSGFKAVTAEESMIVNGGKGSVSVGVSGVAISTTNRNSVIVNPNPESPSITAMRTFANGNYSITLGASISYSYPPFSAVFNSASLVFKYSYY